MNRTRRLRLVLCTLLCFVLCSCQTLLPANEKAQVEELLRAPKLSGDYGALQTALNDWLGESAQLKYPIQGELLSPFVLQDLDGDGQQDAAVLYTTAQTANVCVAILQRDDTGSWQVRQSVEGLAETVENVSLAQLQDTDSCQLVVGYTAAQNDHYLAVYSYQDGTLSTILEQQYEQYLVENITGGSSQDLILMSTQEDGSVKIELLTADRKGSFRQVAVNGLSADKFSGCASVAAGAGADGRHYLVLDGWTGISGNNLASVLLRYDENSQQMVPATRISAQRAHAGQPGPGRGRHRGDPHPAGRGGSAEPEPEPSHGFYRLDGLHQQPPGKKLWPAGRGDQLLYRTARRVGGQPETDRQRGI